MLRKIREQKLRNALIPYLLLVLSEHHTLSGLDFPMCRIKYTISCFIKYLLPLNSYGPSFATK